jgi:hypothetical protein
MTPNDSGPERPTDDEQRNEHLTSAEAALDGQVRDALAKIDEGIQNGTFDVEDLAQFRERLAALDILVEDALESEGEIDVSETPALLAQDQARDFFITTAQAAVAPSTSTFTKAAEHHSRARDALDELAAATVGDRVDVNREETPRPATPSVGIQDGPVNVENYPELTHGSSEGDLFASTSGERVTVGANTGGDGWKLSTSLEFDPDTAEWVAAVLLECAQEAREGREWYYNG